jgi:hypothetical protein
MVGVKGLRGSGDRGSGVEGVGVRAHPIYICSTTYRS